MALRVDQYGFVPARGGVLATDGLLPAVEDAWEVSALQAVLPPTRFLRVAAHVEVAPAHVLRLRVFEPVDAAGAAPEEVDVPEPLRPAFTRCVAELAGAPPPPRRPAWSRPGWHAEAEAWAGTPLEQVRIWPLSAVLRAGDAVFRRSSRSSTTSPRSPRRSGCPASFAATASAAGC